MRIKGDEKMKPGDEAKAGPELCEHGIELTECEDCGRIVAENLIEDLAMETYYEKKYGGR